MVNLSKTDGWLTIRAKHYGIWLDSQGKMNIKVPRQIQSFTDNVVQMMVNLRKIGKNVVNHKKVINAVFPNKLKPFLFLLYNQERPKTQKNALFT